MNSQSEVMEMEPTLREFEVFATMAPATMRELVTGATKVAFEAGDTIVSPGEEFPGLVVVLSGQVRVFRYNRAGKEQIFQMAEPGAILGFAGINDRNISPVTLHGRKAGDLLVIPFANVREAIRNDGEFALVLFDILDRRAETLRRMVDEFSLKDAHGRLATWLQRWIERHHPNQQGQFHMVLPFTQSEIAAQIGTVREVISRGFARMEKEGILTASGKRLKILAQSRLREMADR